MANYTHVRVKRTLYKQKIFKLLYEGFDGDVHQLGALAGCNHKTASSNRTLWRRMTADEKEAAYLRSLRALEDHESEEPDTPKTPDWDVSSMDGFHTPYTFQRRKHRRIWVQGY